MLNDPNIGESIRLDGKKYIFSEAPNAPGILYAEIGRKAKVYRVLNDGQAFALKVFKTRYRSKYSIEQIKRISKYQSLPGLAVTQRLILTAQEHPEIIRKYPEFEYSILMPWVEGKSWFNYVTGKSPINRIQCLTLARALINVIYNLEGQDLAHCDLSSSNFIFSSDFSNVELIDIEDMFGHGLTPPSEKPKGTGGYSPNWASVNGIWEAGADRFSTAILVCEILGWQFENIREASEGDSFFSEGEFGNKSKRFRLLSERLEQIHPQLANLFKSVWYSESPEECPKISQWKEIIDAIKGPKIEISPSFIDFGIIKGEDRSQLPTRNITIKNVGAGLLSGQISSNVSWLNVTPQNFTCTEGSTSAHSVSLLANYPKNNPYGNQFNSAISIHDGNSTEELTCRYEISKRLSQVNPAWIFTGILSFFIILVIALSQQAGQASNPATEEPLIPVTEAPVPTSEVLDGDSTNESPALAQNLPVYKADLYYSSNLEAWNVDYYVPKGIELSQAKISTDWIEPQIAGNQRYYGMLQYGENTKVGVIVDVLNQVESRMIFSFEEDKDFSDNPIYYTSNGVMTEPVEFQILYSDGTVEPYAIEAYYLPDRAPGELLFYRASLREGIIQLPDQQLPIAIFDDNADGLYSDLENIEIKTDLNQDGSLDYEERIYPASSFEIGKKYYKVVEINPTGTQIILQEAQFGQVVGTIADAYSGTPISDAQITTYPLGVVAISNADGQYSFQIPEGSYWQFSVLADGFVPEYAYPQESVLPGQTIEFNVSLSQPSGITRGTVQFHDGDSYHFLSGIMGQYVGGDYYFGFSDGLPQFLANNLYQLGIIDLGYDPNIELDQVAPPESGYYMYGVEAIINHVYVSPAKEGETGHYVIFRVKTIKPGQYVEIEYYYD